MKLFRFSAVWVLIAASGLWAGCSRSYKFLNAPPAAEASDQKPSALPQKTDFNFVENSVSSSVRYPLVRAMDTRRTPRSLDVNSMDQVPASSWFTPRLGIKTISSGEIVKGPEVKGPPQPPLTIIKTKNGGNSPGFIIKDARGLKYLIKFDRTEYPDLESTANFIGNRLFWAFGYHVPEDHLFSFSPSDASAAEGIDQQEIDKVLLMSSIHDDGRYRAVASLFLEGKILGPIPQRGTRRGDVNDKIPHENRRVLRALRMFCAWLDNTGMRSDNSLDVYSGEPGKGHTVHYILDFGEIFGIHGLEKNRPWDGFEHFFSWKDTALNFSTLGFLQKKWEDFKLNPENFQDNFDAAAFEPHRWKETTQFLPMSSSLADDDYWAAKIIAAVQPEHLEALFKSAGHPDNEYSKSVLETLRKRQEKVINYVFGQVSPLEFLSLEEGILRVEDLGEKLPGAAEYQVRFLNDRSKKIAANLLLRAGKNGIEIPVNQAVTAAKGYLLVEVTAVRGGKPSPRAAQFHVRKNEGVPAIVGVVH